MATYTVDLNGNVTKNKKKKKDSSTYSVGLDGKVTRLALEDEEEKEKKAKKITSSPYKTKEAEEKAIKKAYLDTQFGGLSYEQVQEEKKKYSPDSDEYKYLTRYTGYNNLHEFDKAIEEASKPFSYNGLQLTPSEVTQQGLTVPLANAPRKAEVFANTLDANKKAIAPIKFNTSSQITAEILKLPNQQTAENEATFSYDAEYVNSLQTARNKHELDNKFDYYAHYKDEKDFEEKSVYDPKKVEKNWLGNKKKTDELYHVINLDSKARQQYTMGSSVNPGQGIPEEWNYVDYMSEDEKKVFNYLFNTDKKKAQEYFDDIKTNLSRRNAQRVVEQTQAMADKAPVASSVLSVPLNVIGGVTGGVQTAIDKAQGKETDYYSGAFGGNLMAGTIRNRVGQNIAEKTEGVEVLGTNVPSFLYQTAMSMGDTIVGGATLGKAYSVVAGSSAYQSKARELYEAGEDKETIEKVAIASGLAEVAFEYIELGKWLDTATAVGKKQILKKALSQAGVEGLSEGMTEISNIIIDTVGRDDNSELKQMQKELKEKGYTDEEIEKQLRNHIIRQVSEAVVGGAVSGSALGGTTAAINNKFTESEQSFIHEKVQERVEAKESESRKKVTAKERQQIQDDVVKELRDGEFTRDEIEKRFGGESYTEYQELVKERDEFNSLREMKNGDRTGVQDERLYDLRKRNKEKSYNDRLAEARSKLSETVNNATQKDKYLGLTYGERGKRGETFTISEEEKSKYSKKELEVLNKAVESGEINNTRKAHEFVGLVAKLSADKGVSFDFTNNEKLKTSGFAVEGKTIDGFKQGSNITVNMQSKKALNKVVGHEITHVLEGTNLYDALQGTLKEYATSKGVYDSMFETAKENYKNVYTGLTEAEYNAKIEQEVTADLVGEYIFSDMDFVRNLSTKNPDVFQKVYNEIKYMLKIATSGSNEAKELEKVKRAFENAYKESAKKTDTKKSRTQKNKAKTVERQLTEAQKQEVEGEKSSYTPSNDNISEIFEYEEYDYHERNYTMSYVKDDNLEARMKYIEKEQGVEILSLRIYEETEGVAQELVQELKNKYPDQEIVFFAKSMRQQEIYKQLVSESEKRSYEENLKQYNESLYEISDYEEYHENLETKEYKKLKKEYDELRHVVIYPKLQNADAYRDTKRNTSEDVRYALTQYTEQQEQSILKGDKREILKSTSDVKKFTERTLNSNEHETFGYLGVVSSDVVNRIKNEVTEISAEHRENLFKRDAFSLRIRQSEITHLKKMGMTIEEAVDYVVKIPQIVTEFDTVRYAVEYKEGKRIEGLRFSKTFPDGKMYNYLMISNRKGTMTVKTSYMSKDDYMKKGEKNKPSLVANTENVLTNTSETGSPSASNNILANSDNSSIEKSQNDSEKEITLNKITNDGLTMTYVRVPNQNTQNYGSKYGQNIEPAGEYMSMDTSQGKNKIDGYEYGTIQFKKPLVLEHKNTSDTGWKKTVSDMYNGLTGKKLTSALIKDGYDAIVTYDEYGYSEIVNLNGVKIDNPQFSLTDNAKPIAPTKNDIYGKDVAIEKPLAPLREDVAEKYEEVTETQPIAPIVTEQRTQNDVLNEMYAPVTEEEANNMLNSNENFERVRSLQEVNEPQEIDEPAYDNDVEVNDPFEERDIKEVGKRNVNAYMYDNPEVKPFYQAEASIMLGELQNTVKGERFYNDQLYYDTNGEQGFDGTSRMTSDEIAELLDNYKYSYAEIEKGLKAIIEDHGAENIAVAKRIEFFLNERLLNGYTDFQTGMEVPRNQDYVNTLEGIQVNESHNIDSVIEAPVYDFGKLETTTERPIAPVREVHASKPLPITQREVRGVKMNAGRPPIAPLKTEQGKMRRWAETSTESEVVNREILPSDLDQSKIYYEPISNKQTLNTANANFDRMGYDKALEVFNAKLENRTVSLSDIALGERLVQESLKRGDTKTTGELIQNIAILGTELGQKVQALSIIQRMTPEGQLKMLQKVVNRGKAKGDRTFENVEITQEMIDKILAAYGKDGTYDQNKLNEAVERVKHLL